MTKQIEISAILYDLDGTLIDTIPVIVESYQTVFRKFLGHELDPEVIKSYIGLPLEDYFFNQHPDHGQEMLAEYLAVNHKLVPTRVAIFRGVVPMLASLHQAGYPQGIVTSKRRDSAIISLNDFELLPYLDVIITKNDTVRHKPNPDPLLFAMKQLGLSDPRQMLYVGDSVHDILAARNAGCPVAVVDWTDMPKEQLRQLEPDLWLMRSTELAARVRRAPGAALPKALGV